MRTNALAIAMGLVFSSLAGASTSISASPSFINFFNQAVGGGTQFAYVTVTNLGNEDAQNLNVNQACGGSFFVYGSCGFSLPRGGSCSVSIQYRPIFAGFHTCSVYVSGSNTNSAVISAQGQAH